MMKIENAKTKRSNGRTGLKPAKILLMINSEFILFLLISQLKDKNSIAFTCVKLLPLISTSIYYVK